MVNFLYALFGLVVGITVTFTVSVIGIYTIYGKRRCNGTLVIGNDSSMYLQLNETVDETRRHKLIFLEVVQVSENS